MRRVIAAAVHSRLFRAELTQGATAALSPMFDSVGLVRL
jgi:hypothetical protein